MNPLLDFSGLPRFADIKTEHVTPAVDTLLADCNTVVEQVCAAAVSATWSDFVEPLENANERLGRALTTFVNTRLAAYTRDELLLCARILRDFADDLPQFADLPGSSSSTDCD